MCTLMDDTGNLKIIAFTGDYSYFEKIAPSKNILSSVPVLPFADQLRKLNKLPSVTKIASCNEDTFLPGFKSQVLNPLQSEGFSTSDMYDRGRQPAFKGRERKFRNWPTIQQTA